MAFFDRVQRLWRSKGKRATSLFSGSMTPTAQTSQRLLPKAPKAPPLGVGVSASVAPGNNTANGAISGATSPSPAVQRKDDHPRLPDAMWKPEQEFPGSLTIGRNRMMLSRESQILMRIARVALLSILKPMRLMFVGGFSVCVVGITSYEAHVLLDPACSLADAMAFTFKYSLENFNASVIWETRDAALVAQSLGLNPEMLLKQLDPAKNPSDAQLLLNLHGMYTTRSIIAGSMVIAQVLSMIRESMLATTKYIENVYNGKEPPLKGVTERIIRLAGDGSDVTEVSMARYGAHILPVYENPAKWRHLIGLWSHRGWIPCVWQVDAGHYGYRHSWEELEVDETFMLRTTTGKFILCIEADATNLDRAHELQKPNNDVTLEEASQAYRMIERAVSRNINRPYRSLAVFLGDSLQLCDTGGTEFVTLRERIRLKKEVDVLIDAKAPLLLAILKWCGRFAEKHKTIVLDATPLNYAPLQLLLEKNGYTVLTPAEADAWNPPLPPPDDKDGPQPQQQQLQNKGINSSSSSSSPSTGQSNSSSSSNSYSATKTSSKSTSTSTSTEKEKEKEKENEDGKTKEKDNGKENAKDKDKESSGKAKEMAKEKEREIEQEEEEKEKPPPGAKPPTATIVDKKEKLPRLIYYPTTSATINAVHSVLSAGLAEPKHCCVLINSPFGLAHLREISEYEDEDFYPICAAEIYDDYFRQVRIWTRMGHSAATIQNELDTRFAPVLDVQTEISQLERSTTTMKKL